MTGSRCRPAVRWPLLVSLLLVLGSLAPREGAAEDPPYRIEEVTAEGNRIVTSGKDVWGYADASGEYALVTDGVSLLVVDVTDPVTPVVATRVPTVAYDLKDVKTYKHYAYCVNQGGPIQIVDLSDPYHAYTIATFSSPNIPGAHNIWCSEDGFAYVALMGAGNSDLRILDLADPLRPVERGGWQHIEQGGLLACHDVYVRNDTCYASWFGAGLYILDVSDKDHPRRLQNILYPDRATHNAWPTVDGQHVFTTDERNGGHLLVWGLDGRYASPVGEYMTEGTAIIHNAHVKGDRIYISYYTAGVRIADITDPRNPVEVGRFDTSRYAGPRFAGCWGMYPYAPSGLVYASDMEEGLFVLRYLDSDDGIARGFVRVHGAESSRLEGAEVRFVESGVRAVSDRTGYYQAALYPGTHTVRVSHPDFHEESFTVTVEARGAIAKDVFLDPMPGPPAFVAEPVSPVALGDGRLRVMATVREHGSPISAVTLRYRSGGGGGFLGVPMERVDVGSEDFAGAIPTQLPGTLVQYFIEAVDEGGATVFSPAGAPELLLSYRVGNLDWTVVYATDFETDTGGFTVGSAADRGERGVWERAIPYAIYPDSILIDGRLTQPSLDATPGDGPGYCFLTELGREGIGSQHESYPHEVEGRTTLTSPVIDLGEAVAVRLECSVWYVNDLGGSRWQDPFLIEGSTDGGLSWRVIAAERVVAPGWQPLSIDLDSRLELGPELMIRFVAADEVSPSLIEAAIDDVRVMTTQGYGPGVAGETPPVLLRQNLPNPFNPSTTITFQLKEPRQVKLEIYDVAGHLVRRLVDGSQQAGDHAVVWDGRDVRGFAAPSGVYFYRLAAQDITDMRKMLLLK